MIRGVRARAWYLMPLLLTLAVATGLGFQRQTIGQVDRSQVKSRVTAPCFDEGASVYGQVIETPSGRPLPSVQVRAQMGGAPPVTVLTDDDGCYQFSAMPAGQYSVTFLKGGFVSLQFGQRFQFDEVRAVDVQEGRAVSALDVALPAGGVIEGRVVDERGEPIVEARVSAMRVQFFEGRRRLEAAGRAAETDDRGFFRLYGLSAGEYVVGAEVASNSLRVPAPAPRPSAGFAPTYYPSTEDPAGALRVSVRAGGEVSGIEIAFRRVRLARVSGIVTTSSGRLDSGTHVALTRLVSGPAALLLSPLVSVSGVSRDGSFVVAGVPPGQFVLQARSIPASVVDSVATTGRITNRTLATGEIGTYPIVVDGVDIADVALATAPMGHVSGRAMLDDDASAAPQGRSIQVAAIAASSDAVSAGPSAVPIESSGRFDIAGLAGLFLIRVSGLPRGVYLDHVDAGGRDVSDSGVDVPPGQSVTGLTVHLTSHPTRLSGRVTIERGGDLSGCDVVVFAADKERWEWPSSRFLGSARAQRDGRFQLEGLPAGSYLAIALSYVEKGQWRDPDFLAGAAPNAQRVALTNGGSQTIELPCFVK